MTSSRNKWSMYLLLIPARSAAAMESYLRKVFFISLGEHVCIDHHAPPTLNCPVAVGDAGDTAQGGDKSDDGCATGEMQHVSWLFTN